MEEYQNLKEMVQIETEEKDCWSVGEGTRDYVNGVTNCTWVKELYPKNRRKEHYYKRITKVDYEISFLQINFSKIVFRRVNLG